ncbi:LysR family transcriptional regulator [Steroidobacter sp.]|uniref:LysR family transcriptional regulator n=1 Tax=Steroidobacter sp. TaxID=1978227 RepID=UPI001A63B398|nr:LysR family transcriptional regulator [Steroidobacter sp.]MBL8265089.1 LysR family transcriptional regulator [Steroidobacter sp.]
MELRQLRYFIAVAELGSFSRAAHRLHISQPPLSVQVKALEDELGVRLLNRTTRGASLTAAGTAFFEEARAALVRLESAKSKALLAERGDIGTLAIGFVSIADYGILPPALKSFRSSYPLVEVQLHELTTDAQLRELRASRLDLGIALGPVGEPDMQFDRLLQEELVLAAPAGHALAKGEGTIDLRTLSKESFIIPPRDIAPGLYDLIHDHCRSFGFAPRITQHARQMQTVISLVASGMGFALVPSSLRNLKRHGVQYRRLRGKAARVELGILRSRGASSPLVDRFIEALRSAAR